MLDLIFLIFYFRFWSSKLAMEVEHLEKWKFIASRRFKEQNLNKKNQFYHPPIFKFITFSLFSSLPSFGTKA